jgi:hypothetical protein
MNDTGTGITSGTNGGGAAIEGDPAGGGSADGGFAGDLAEALAVAGADGCCGSAPRATLTLHEPAAGGPCCGTQAEASAESACCGSAAKSTAVASGQGCCG